MFFVTRSWSRAVTDTLPALTVPAAISAVTVLPSVTRERPPDPAKAPLNSPIVAAAATATPSDVTFACDSAVSTTAFAAVTSGAAPWSAAAIRARTVSRIVVSRITTPGASDTPLPIVTASAPAPARDVIAGLSMAETDTDPACDVTLADSTSAATVLESVVKTLAPEPAPEIPSPVTAASVVNVTVLRLPAPASGNKTPPLPNDASALPATETAKIVLPSAALGLPPYAALVEAK